MKKVMLSLILGVMLIGIMGIVIAECVDTDGGDDYSTKGEVTSNDANSVGNGLDYCIGNDLAEKYCDGEIPKIHMYNCLGSCVDGACIGGVKEKEKEDEEEEVEETEKVCKQLKPNAENRVLCVSNNYTNLFSCDGAETQKDICNSDLTESSMNLCYEFFIDSNQDEQYTFCEYGCEDGVCLEEEEEIIACCQAMTASCLACSAGVSVEKYCENSCTPNLVGCEECYGEDESEIKPDKTRMENGLGQIIRGEIKAGVYTNEDGDQIRVRELAQNRFEFRFGNYSAETELEVEEETEGNITKFKIQLSNGRDAEVKVMPNVASERALERLRLKRCNNTEVNCSIELKEVGQGDQARLAYEIRAQKTFKILGFIKNRENVMTQIDAENGEEIRYQRPWWSFMASEEDEAEEI